jgi:hypothetical protein
LTTFSGGYGSATLGSNVTGETILTFVLTAPTKASSYRFLISYFLAMASYSGAGAVDFEVTD